MTVTENPDRYLYYQHKPLKRKIGSGKQCSLAPLSLPVGLEVKIF